MTTPTAARTKPDPSSHWYSFTAEPCYEVPKKDGSGMRKATLADARKNNWLPSVTTILRVLEKPALTQWKIEQAALAVLTSPRKEGEGIDAFVYRVLHEDKEQDQESQIARDKGTEIHKAFEDYFSGQAQLIEPGLLEWIQPAINAILAFGERASSEMILVGDGYAGKTDLVQDCEACWRMWDIKSTKNLPDPIKGAYPEHKLQLAGYGRAYVDRLIAAKANTKPLLVGNIYVSSVTPGQFVICEHEDWERTYELGFKPLIKHWQWANNYTPANPTKPRFDETPQTDPQVEAMRKHYVKANARVAELERNLTEKIAKMGNLPEPAPEVVAPRTPGAMPTNPSLPTHSKDGKRISWSTGVAVAPAAQTLPGTP